MWRRSTGPVGMAVPVPIRNRYLAGTESKEY
jgi:hypothetical protein